MRRDEWNATYKDGVDEGWVNLQIAVIKQAVKDYVVWQKQLAKLRYKLDTERFGSPAYRELEFEVSKKEGKIKDMERWFLSEWGQLLSCGRGEAIIETYGNGKGAAYEHNWADSESELYCGQQDTREEARIGRGGRSRRTGK